MEALQQLDGAALSAMMSAADTNKECAARRCRPGPARNACGLASAACARLERWGGHSPTPTTQPQKHVIGHVFGRSRAVVAACAFIVGTHG